MQKISWTEGIIQLEAMFPTISSVIIEKTLRDNGGHMEMTIDMLLSLSLELENQSIQKKENEEKQYSSQSIPSKEMTDEELARHIQEHEFGMYKALGGRKTMNEFVKEMEKPSDQQRKETKKDQQMTSFWNTLSEGAKHIFKEMFGSSTSYTKLDSDDHRLFFFY